MLFHFWPGDDEHPFVALTIDDGPCPQNTALLLDILKENEATATFFIIGDHVAQCDQDEDYGRQLLRRMVEEGHELGNHTWHDRASIGL